jgi:hypothetical protein
LQLVFAALEFGPSNPVFLEDLYKDVVLPVLDEDLSHIIVVRILLDVQDYFFNFV